LLIQASKLINSNRRTAYYYECLYREKSEPNKGFIETLTADETVDVIKTAKHLVPEDFSSDFFNQLE